MSRRFSGKQRAALFIATQGHCAECHNTLPPAWHADHIQPYSKGGTTDVLNGQALCPRCNLKKGNKDMSEIAEWPADFKLRSWQERALNHIEATDKNDFLVVATPGSGKTKLALRYAHKLLTCRQVERIVFVCPTDHLRSQWADNAAQVGIDLDPKFSNSDVVEAEDYHGVVVTYQQVSYGAELFRLNCRRRTLLVFDEIHHVGDELAWGNALRHAFEPAAFRLALTGTAFRSDNNPIPFVTYEDGRSRADFEYGYAQSLADGVCRPVYFPSFEGQIEWLSNDGEKERRSLLDHLSRAKASERLRAALSTSCDWIQTVLREANQKLSEIRAEGHNDAAGLVIAMNQFHAKNIAKLLTQITGIEPVIAISEAPDASERIKRFSESKERWIVAVKMISEGVDIPRLRVGVYATNVLSELYFRQAVGRLVRCIEGLEEQSASLFIPADEVLVEFARTIKQERDHQLGQDKEKAVRSSEKEQEEDEVLSYLFAPLSSEPRRYDVIFDGSSFNQAELDHATQVGDELGIKLPAAQVAALLRRGAAQAGVHLVHGTESLETVRKSYQSKYDRKISLRRTVHRLASRLARVLGIEIKEIHALWIKSGGTPQGSATEQELRRKEEWLKQRLREAREEKFSANLLMI
jgi:superfamily II DNA or RNA helicase